MNNIKEKIDRDGWVIIKNVFTPTEIKAFRKAALATQDYDGDVLANDKLNHVITDDRILDIFKNALGTEELVYFGDSTVSIDRKGGGFHKDSRDREDETVKQWSDLNYSLLRMGIYLQDHSTHSGGLSLRDKSHLTQSTKKGKIINAASEVGDVVLWKLTTTHSANANRLAFAPQLGIEPTLIRRFPSFLLQKTTRPRIAIFACFGRKDDYFIEYIEYLKTRRYAVERWRNQQYTQQQINTLEQKNVRVFYDFQLSRVDESRLV